MPKRDVEERLDQMLRRSGEETVQRLRDEARGIAGELHLRTEFKRLDTLIGTLLGSRETPLESPVAVARAAGLLPNEGFNLNINSAALIIDQEQKIIAVLRHREG